MKTSYLTRSLVLCTTVVLMSLSSGAASANADDAKPAASQQTKDAATELKDFQCRKISNGGSGIAELKESLLENCNVNLPYSFTSASIGLGGGSSFVYCCHTKAGS